jgi:hypothetical protein
VFRERDWTETEILFLRERFQVTRGPVTVLTVCVGSVAPGLLIVRLPALVALVAPLIVVIIALRAAVSLLTGEEEDDDGARRIWAWTLASLVLHLAVGLLLFDLRDTSLFPPDAVKYDEGARQLVDHWTRELPMARLPSGKEGFFYLVAGLYRVLGPHAEAALVVNAAMVAALVPLMTDVTRRMFGSAAARFVAPLVVLLPGLMLWTSSLLREAGICFLIALATNAAVRLTSKITPSTILVMTSALALLFTFRGNVALLVAAGLVIGLTIGHRELVSGLSAGLGAMVILLGVVVGLGLGYSGYRVSVEADLEQVEGVRGALSTSAASGFTPEADVSTTRGALSYLPTGFVNFFLGPFPWQMKNARQLIALPDVLVWWFLLPSLVRGVRTGARRIGRRVIVLLVPAFMTTLMLSLLIGNFGTVLRERVQLVVLLVPFIALGLALRGARPLSENLAESENGLPLVLAPTAAIRS